MNGLFRAALEAQEFFGQLQWRFTIIGGLAVIRWGEPYATQDVDISLFTGFGQEDSYVGAVLSRFPGRIPDAGRFALLHRVLLVSASNGVPIDIGLAAIPFEEELIARSSYFCFLPDVNLLTCSAEDLVVLKAFAGRSKDWAAIEGVIARQGRTLDWGYVESRLEPLCELKDEPSIVQQLMRLRDRMGRTCQ